MITVKETHNVYLSSFMELEKKLKQSAPSWVSGIRRSAIERFAELGFPTTRLEDWKYTSVAAIAKTPFQPAAAVTRRASLGEPTLLPYHLDCPELVFVNGLYAGELSSLSGLPAGVKTSSLAAALAGGIPALEEHLARYASYEDHAFVALNTAFMADGALIEIPKDVILDKPIHLLYVSATNGHPMVTYPRNLVLVGRASQASFIETYASVNLTTGFASEAVYFTNSVTEVVAAEGAVVDYSKVQQESEQAFHVATVQVYQERSSSVTTHTIGFGSALDREEVTAVLDGDGAESLLHGLYVINGRQHVDNHTVIDHAKPHCSSRELYKGILDGNSTGVFNGKIIVRQDAQKTDSKQSNKNLLLSENAVINTKPQLEIYADDVKCTHGATIGQIDSEALFYLRSRGIGLIEARAMLTQAFASDVIEKIKFGPLRAWLKDELLARLGKGQESGARSQEPEETKFRISKLAER